MTPRGHGGGLHRVVRCTRKLADQPPGAISEEALLCDAAAAIGAAIKKVDATPGRLDAMQRALVRERGRFLFTDATEAPGAAERAAPGTPPDETEREMHAMIIRQIEAQRNGADGSFLARDWIKEAGTRPARCEA